MENSIIKNEHLEISTRHRPNSLKITLQENGTRFKWVTRPPPCDFEKKTVYGIPIVGKLFLTASIKRAIRS